jgi:hypothetical protein
MLRQAESGENEDCGSSWSRKNAWSAGGLAWRLAPADRGIGRVLPALFGLTSWSLFKFPEKKSARFPRFANTHNLTFAVRQNSSTDAEIQDLAERGPPLLRKPLRVESFRRRKWGSRGEKSGPVGLAAKQDTHQPGPWPWPWPIPERIKIATFFQPLNQAKVSHWEGDKTKLPACIWGSELEFPDAKRIQRISNPSVGEIVIEGMNLLAVIAVYSVSAAA